ncbi:Zn-ribbon domain-containing OB-fold protein [Saccharococcus sp. Marseille-Q5394]|uniref:Zn-ribbon domain-containing OB-fold protein n=1 Tax=Saccharococcus sp. Marseille-Q5394 TaxID=2972778 RepID=UPI0021CA56D3|nr:OB-fold domain-containing protein [Saccharococcus sp. Marseille-Q5394]
MKIFKCNSCDYVSVSSKYTCPQCRTGKLEAQEVSPIGTVFSFTDIHIAPAEFADIAPYTIALIQLDEANVKVTARMDDPVQIGDKADLDKMENGAYLYKKL